MQIKIAVSGISPHEHIELASVRAGLIRCNATDEFETLTTNGVWRTVSPYDEDAVIALAIQMAGNAVRVRDTPIGVCVRSVLHIAGGGPFASICAAMANKVGQSSVGFSQRVALPRAALDMRGLSVGEMTRKFSHTQERDFASWFSYGVITVPMLIEQAVAAAYSWHRCQYDSSRVTI